MSDFSSHFQFLLRGGFMMVPLLISGLIALAVSIERIWFLKFKLHTPKEQLRSWLEELKNGHPEKARREAEKVASPVAGVIVAGLRDLSAPTDEVELSMQNEAEMWVPLIERRLEILDTVITAAPLMGLLGTITGMMGSFQGLSEKGVGEPGAITGGVAEALIATATGLVIALLTLIVFNYLNQVAKDLIVETEGASARFIEARKFAFRALNGKPQV